MTGGVSIVALVFAMTAVTITSLQWTSLKELMSGAGAEIRPYCSSIGDRAGALRGILLVVKLQSHRRAFTLSLQVVTNVISASTMIYVLAKSRRIRHKYIARPLALRIALERNIAVTRALLPSLALQTLCTAATSIHILVVYEVVDLSNLYMRVGFYLVVNKREKHIYSCRKPI